MNYVRTIVFLSLIAVVAVGSTLLVSSHASASRGRFRTESHDDALPNYDIRQDGSAKGTIAAFRDKMGKRATDVTDVRARFVRGETELRARIPNVRVEYNADIRTPELISPDSARPHVFLTARSKQKRSDILVNFLQENPDLTGVSPADVSNLRLAADYSNPEDGLSFVEFDQEINGIPIFRGEVKAGFTADGEMMRVVNNLAPSVSSASTDFGNALDAVTAAAAYINCEPSRMDLAENDARSTALKAVFGGGDMATTAEKMYFATEPGVVVPAWRVLIWRPVNAFYVVVDATGHEMLWRKDITEDQTQAATYSVYTNPNAMINVAHNPFPISPGPFSPDGVQGAALSRTAVTLIGNEPPNAFNNLGWLTDGTTITDGNAVQAGLDRDGVDGIDTGSEAVSPTRNFTFAYNPLDPNTGLGDRPLPRQQTYPGTPFQEGTITQLFYICNWYHDELYRLGFTEQARNFQNSNFGRGGVEGDRVSAEGQDSSGTNNANFSTPADGGRGRMQMYIFTGPTPNIDGDLDADVIVHEHTHGVSNRLIGNGSGLLNDMSRGMGEGWSDFYGLSLLSQASDPLDGVYTTAEYDTYMLNGSFVNNAYYGIRRFPYAIRTSVGGPDSRPHNPLTFADIDSTKIDLSDGAFPPRFDSTSDEVHNAGEIWCSALWEIRARMIARLGWDIGNRHMLQLVTDGMKISPLSPTFLSGRDAIIAAALGGGTSDDVADIWAGFALRGMGASASIQNVGGTSIGGTGTARVTEAFDLPNLDQAPELTISDTGGNNNGVPDPGETVTLNIPLTNSTGNAAAGTTLQLAGGGSANYGTIQSGTTVSQSVSFTVPPGSCGNVVTLTLNVNSSLGPTNFSRTFAVGTPNSTATEGFDGVVPPAFPAGWATTAIQGGTTFVTTATTPDGGVNAAFAQDPTSIGGGTDLTSPMFAINAPAATVSFRQKYETELNWDGGVLEISIGGGPFQDILAAGGTFVQNGYSGTLGPGTNNPLANRAAWNGDSGGYVTTFVRLPSAAAGQNVQFKWRFGADDNTAVTGWWVDTVQVSGSYSCTAATPRAVRADFDGDGKTDVSVYRPSEGNWYVEGSSAGFSATHFGDPTDIIAPGDFDGDGRADIAVFRPSTGTWFIFYSDTNQLSVVNFGAAGDIPQPRDFDGDGKDDIAVWRPSTGVWFWLNSSNGQFNAVQFGQVGDKPIAGDYDGDGKADVSVFRPSTGSWFRLNSSDGSIFAVGFGLSTDLPVPADYDGDGKLDVAVFRPDGGLWFWLNSSNAQLGVVQFGADGDVPAPGDYDGDGKADQAVYRNGIWYMNRSTTGFAAAAFGLSGDTPVPRGYLP